MLLLWRKFERWLAEQQAPGALLVNQEMHRLETDFRESNFFLQKFLVLHQCLQFKALLKIYHMLCERLSSSMAQFWLSYVDMVQLLLNYIRSLRLADWKLYLSCIRRMLPWVFGYDRTHYSRFLSYHWCEMMTLKNSHPEAASTVAEW